MQPSRRGLRSVRTVLGWLRVIQAGYVHGHRLATCTGLACAASKGCVGAACTCGFFSFSFFQLIREGDTRSSTIVVSGSAQ